MEGSLVVYVVGDCLAVSMLAVIEGCLVVSGAGLG
jgi:hypothetical protein